MLRIRHHSLPHVTHGHANEFRQERGIMQTLIFRTAHRNRKPPPRRV